MVAADVLHDHVDALGCGCRQLLVHRPVPVDEGGVEPQLRHQPVGLGPRTRAADDPPRAQQAGQLPGRAADTPCGRRDEGTGAPRGRRIWWTAESFPGRRPEALAGVVAEGDGAAVVGWTDIGDS
ncbi:hypothetical protein GCM10010295_23490 [Streptomyces intermedius]